MSRAPQWYESKDKGDGLMSKLEIKIYLSYSQICIFQSTLQNPYNDWSDRNFSQGFSWRPGSASFRTIAEDGDHQVSLFINEPVPPLSTNCVRAFKVPFETLDGKIEIASISDSTPLDIPPGKYILRVEILHYKSKTMPEINVRLNLGVSDFEVSKADGELDVTSNFDLMARAAT
jgi:hypothetical protein